MRYQCIGYIEDHDHIPREFTIGKFYESNKNNIVLSDSKNPYEIKEENNNFFAYSKWGIYNFEKFTIRLSCLQQRILKCSTGLENGNMTKGEAISELFNLSNMEIT